MSYERDIRETMKNIIQSINPATGAVVGEVSVTTEDELQSIVAKSKKVEGWQGLDYKERVSKLKIAYQACESEATRLAKLLCEEMGKDIQRALGEVQGTIFGGPYIAESVAEALQAKSYGRTVKEYKPLGTVGIISPWNYPLAMANNLLIPALVAGNSVIWKPSEETPLVAQEFFDILVKNLPEGLLQIIHGDREQGRQLVESDIQMIAFTGSQATGRDIMSRAASNLKRLVMELGGNDPMIVMDDADLPSAARFAVASSFENAGQMCISTERIYVHESVERKFCDLVLQTVERYTVGPWDLSGVNIGPIVNEKQHQHIIHHLSDAVDKGAELLYGSVEQKPPYIQPVVLSGMVPEMLIEKEETFGPVICITSYSDIDEAINRANNSTYGLGATVFGGTEADKVADRLEAGMIGINQGIGGEGDSPWVGAKQSGFGFHGSPEGHRQFAQVRVVSR